jgi:hypothetical protein
VGVILVQLHLEAAGSLHGGQHNHGLGRSTRSAVCRQERKEGKEKSGLDTDSGCLKL